jgi:hypothetical protein
MNVLFIASMSVVAADPPQSRKLFVDALGLPLEKYEADEYYSSESIPGSRHFGVWPLSQAAGSELQRAGFELLHPARTEPSGQTVTRLLTEDGLIVGISYAPSLHDGERA